MTIVADQPFLHGEILQRGRAPVPAKLKIDTGLNGSFVAAQALVRKGQKVLPQPGIALGGITENDVSRLGDLRRGDRNGLPEMRRLLARPGRPSRSGV